MNTQVTTHRHSIPQATHAHPRPRQSAHNNTATILHTPMRARQTLNHHVTACTQHRHHAEHSPKACMVQKANEQGTPPSIQGGHHGRQKAGCRGRGGRGKGEASNAGGKPQTPAREPRGKGVREGESRGTVAAQKRYGRGRRAGGGGEGGGRRREWSTLRGDSRGGGQSLATRGGGWGCRAIIRVHAHAQTLTAV